MASSHHEREGEDQLASVPAQRELLLTIFDILRERYGPQSWWPSRTGSRWEIMLGAVLTQRTSWTNVEKSLAVMLETWGEQSLADPDVVLSAQDEELATVLRPTGFYTSKPRTLQNLARYVVSKGGADNLAASAQSTEQIRADLLDLWGIGRETADAILLYALGRPAFVADAYALRLASRWGLIEPTAGYEKLRALFLDTLPHDTSLYNEYHALIVMHGKQICKPRPLCETCPLNEPLRIGADKGGEVSWAWRCPKANVAAQREANR